jgi:hypothetical protein
LEPYVETIEPHDLQGWNDLADEPHLWTNTELISDLKKPMRKGEDGKETDDWTPQVRPTRVHFCF